MFCFVLGVLRKDLPYKQEFVKGFPITSGCKENSILQREFVKGGPQTKTKDLLRMTCKAFVQSEFTFGKGLQLRIYVFAKALCNVISLSASP